MVRMTRVPPQVAFRMVCLVRRATLRMAIDRVHSVIIHTNICCTNHRSANCWCSWAAVSRSCHPAVLCCCTCRLMDAFRPHNIRKIVCECEFYCGVRRKFNCFFWFAIPQMAMNWAVWAPASSAMAWRAACRAGAKIAATKNHIAFIQAICIHLHVDQCSSSSIQIIHLCFSISLGRAKYQQYLFRSFAKNHLHFCRFQIFWSTISYSHVTTRCSDGIPRYALHPPPSTPLDKCNKLFVMFLFLFCRFPTSRFTIHIILAFTADRIMLCVQCGRCAHTSLGPMPRLYR